MDFKRGRGVVAQARLIILNVYAFLYFIECVCITHISLMVKTKAVYIAETFEQLIHLFITICAEQKMSVSQVIPSTNRMLFSKIILQSRAN